MRGWIPNFGAGNSLGRLRCAPCCQALSKKVCRGISHGTPQSIDLQVIGFRKHTDKLKFARRAGVLVFTNVVYFRFLPDPFGIVLCREKLEFEEGSAGPEQHCHAEPVRTLVWESPSTFRLLFVLPRRGAHLERPPGRAWTQVVAGSAG